jgi:hypothetical protein
MKYSLDILVGRWREITGNLNYSSIIGLGDVLDKLMINIV